MRVGTVLLQFSQRGEGGFAFGGFLALASAASQFHIAVMDGALEETVVVRATDRNDVVMGGFGRDGLEQFLEFALGIFENRDDGDLAESAQELAKNEVARGFESPVNKNRPEQGLKGVCEGRRSLPAAVHFFATAKGEVGAEAQPPPVFGQGTAVDEFGAGFGEGAFANGREFFVELARQDELQDGIAEELEALVSLNRSALLVGNGGVGEREPQERRFAEGIAQLALEFSVFGHGGNGKGLSRRQGTGEVERGKRRVVRMACRVLR